MATLLFGLSWLASTLTLAQTALSVRGRNHPRMFAFDMVVLVAGIVLWIVAVRYRARRDASW